MIIVNRVTDVGRKVVLSILSGLGSRPTKGPSVTKSRASIAWCGAHGREGRVRRIGLAGHGRGSDNGVDVDVGRLLCICQCIFRAGPFHYNKLIRWKYLERLQVNVLVTLQYLSVVCKTEVSYLPRTAVRKRRMRSRSWQALVVKLGEPGAASVAKRYHGGKHVKRAPEVYAYA